MRTDKRVSQKSDKKAPSRVHKRGIVGYSKKSALLEEAITHMNTGKYGRSSAALKELLALDPQNIEARRLFATLHLRLGSLVTARQAFESLANEAIGRQDYWLAEALLGEYLAAGPRCVPFLEQLAYVYQEKGDEMAAVVELGKAIEILRDDPDPDHPQKAAQLYAKIRELAPASSVALQLAPLFDVQTGEFLAHASASSTPSPEAEADSIESGAVADPQPAPALIEHPLPDVMPWEIPESTTGSASTLSASSASGGAEVNEEIDLSSAPEQEDVEPSIAIFQEQEAVAESPQDDTTFSFKVTEPSSSEPFSGNEPTEFIENEPLPSSPSSIPSPMPWEQMADASVQIVEPEIPPVPDSFSALQSILTALRTEEEAVTSAPVSEDQMPEVARENPQPTALTSFEPEPTSSAALSAPMPWEQVSDPAIQIPLSEPSPAPLTEEVPPPAPVASVESEVLAFVPVADVAPPEPAPEIDASPTQVALSPESSTPSVTDLPPTTSFSWNSVFDKAWKFTAGTMAPSATGPSEKDVQWSDEPHLPETQTETSVEEPFTLAPSQAPAELSSASCSTVAEEPGAADVVSSPPLDPPPEPTSPAPPISSHWDTGEVAVQVHRPSQKKKRWGKTPEEAEESAIPPSSVQPPFATGEPPSDTNQEAAREWKTTTEEAASSVKEMVSQPADHRPDWMQATETITFSRPEPLPTQPRWSDADTTVPSVGEPASAAAVSAVDMLFSPSATVDERHPHLSWSMPRPRLLARLHRVRIGISSFIGSCFSTTRSLGFLTFMIAIAVGVVGAAALAAVAITWMAMEEPPSPLYQALTISPPRVITDAKKNGYLLLLGFDAPAGQDPVQAGYERKTQLESDRAAAQVCMGGDEARGLVGNGGAYDHVVKGWIRSSDPLAHIKSQSVTLKSLTSRESTALTRYQQWLTMSFDDWGFGQSFSPNCPHLLLAHRLFVLEGFNQDLSTGIDRLEADAQAWRTALGQSKTLATKMLAVTAVQDDAAVVSGLLSRVDLDGAALARLSKMVRPLDQVELSVRWPMQSQFVLATKTVQSELKEDKQQDRPWHASMVSAMRLPVQRRANAYAEYYDAANKAVAGGRYMNLPKASTFVRTPASGIIDYLTNPVEHIVGIDSLPSWDPFVMRMMEADAQLRLAGLQAWLRRGPQDSDVPTRLAKAGQAYYDPFTGLPMLVNQRKGMIYSVGRDGKDQEGDAVHDVVAMIPSSEPRRVAFPTSPR